MPYHPLGTIQTGAGNEGNGPGNIPTGTIVDSVGQLTTAGGKIDWVIDQRTRLTNLGYNANTWGKFIPITWGVAVLQGELLWSGGFKERLQFEWWMRTRMEGKHKFMSTLGYYYTVNLIYGFGYTGQSARRRYLNKITLNGTIVYDRPSGYRYPNLQFNFEPGTLEQKTDPKYTQDKGGFAVPFRPMMTVALYDLPIEDFGTAIPTCVIEVYEDPATPLETLEFTAGLSGNDFYPMSYINWLTRTMYVPNNARNQLSAFDIDTRQELYRVPLPADTLNISSYHFIPWKNLIINGLGGGNAHPIAAIDATTGQIVAQFGSYSSLITDMFADPPRLWNWEGAAFAPAPEGIAYILLSTMIFGQLNVLLLTENSFVPIMTHALPAYTNVLAGHPNDSVFWYGIGNHVGRLSMSGRTIDGSAVAGFDDNWLEIPEGRGASGILYWNGILVVAARTGDTNDGTFWYGFDASTKELLWESHTGFVHFATLQKDQSNLTNGLFGWQADGFKVISLSTGSVETIDATLGQGAWDSETMSMFIARNNQPPIQQYARSPGVGGIRLDQWMKELLVYAGWAESDLQFFGINDVILGAFINKGYDVNGIIESVRALYRINKVERDGKLIFYKNANEDGEITADITIDHAELALLERDDNARIGLRYRKIDESNVPAEISVTFINPELEYAEDTYTWARPRSTTTSVSSVSYAVPIIANKSTIAKLTQNMLYDIWEGRTSVSGRLPIKYGRVDPGSVIAINRGAWVDLVRVAETTFNADWTISFEGELVRSRSVANISVDEYVPRPPLLVGKPDSRVVFFDMPTLTRADAARGGNLPVLYYTASGLGQKNWPGAEIRRSTGAETFRRVAIISSSFEPGRVMNVVPSVNGMSDGLVIIFNNGSNPIEGGTKTLDAILADDTTNLAVYGAPGRWEVVQYSTVSFSNGRVTLDGVVRGRRGTEVFIDEHKVGDHFVLVGDANMIAEMFSVDQIGDDITVAAVGLGTTMAGADIAEETIDGHSIRPWAPVVIRNVTASSGDIPLSWKRRDRLGFTELGTATPQPMSEASEAYELEILDGAGDVIRTVSGLTTPAYTYSAADQAADGFAGLPGELSVAVYQMSAVVGRGFPGKATVYVQ